jgi:tetratricopeptide (TPR) repeat protein
MGLSTQSTLLNRAREAAGRGDWREAYDLLSEADATTPLGGPDLAFLADVAYAAGRLDITIGAWERAYSQSMLAGDQQSAAAAAVRVAMHLLFDTAFMAPVRAWIKRAERLLQSDLETPIHAWLAVVRNYERMLSGDFDGARRWARHAIEVGTKCDSAAAAVGRVAEARSLILSGEVSQGLILLNEAALTTTSGELDPLFTGVVYCEVVCALQALAQYDLAQEWTAAMEEWRHGQPVGSIHGRCRVHRAEILRLRGSSAEAETEALLACEELRPYLRREFGWPLTELGRIRLRKGDLQGAEEAFREAHEVGWDPQPGLALVDLARGETTLAAKSIRDALEHPLNVPSKEFPPNTELRRAPLLEAQVEIEVAAGDLDRARSAAEELSRVAALFQSRALSASAALAWGRVRLAEADIEGARREFGAALHLWADIGAPYETAVARMGLAHAYRASGDEERAILEFQAAWSAFERVGAAHKAAEAARECGHSDVRDSEKTERPPRRSPAEAIRAANENVFRREGDHWCVTFEGHTVRLRDLKGMHYLAHLLRYPGRELHVLDLATGEGGRSYDLAPTPLLDAQAKEAYRRRLAEIEEDIEEASALGNVERTGQAEAERDFLARELARAVGLGGRDRHTGSASERARASVTRAVRQAMTRIREHHPAIGAHLERAIRTGTYCVYLPDPRVPTAWRL